MEPADRMRREPAGRKRTETTGERQYGQGGAVHFPVRLFCVQRRERRHSVHSGWLQQVVALSVG